MIPERIGIIGNTQGVRASNRPKPKKLYGGGRAGGARHGQLGILVDRRIADATVPATLGDRLQRHGAGCIHRQQDLHFLAIDLDIAEVLVFLHLARRQLRRAKGAAVQRELELVAVHVVLVGNLPACLDGFRVDDAR
jgi:hypothetical protein